MVHPNFHGKKGRSGRPTARVEKEQRTEAHKLFFDEHDQAKIERKIQTGKFSIKDRFVLTAMEGEERVLTKAYQKAVPDTQETEIKGNIVVNFDPSFE